MRSMQKEYSIFVVGALSNFKTEKDFFSGVYVSCGEIIFKHRTNCMTFFLKT